MRLRWISICFAIWLSAALVSSMALAQERGRSSGVWRFAVSGDSRNCGDIVMPAIAARVKADGTAFYWHLGDFRAIANFDEDYHQLYPNAVIAQYENEAWDDFIERQIKPFGDMPVFLGIGNHETILPKTRTEWLTQFADWLLTPSLRAQRLADRASDHKLKAYYHWMERGVDFVSMDNGSDEQFDNDQVSWIKGVLGRAARNAGVRSVVVGMHRALPDSLSAGHSMNDSAQGAASGRSVYDALLAFRRSSSKPVYVLASHSHLFMRNVYATACRAETDVLPGWIVGTAGAVRYRLPKGVVESQDAIPDTYGYLLGTVAANGTISFEFKKIAESDVPKSTVSQYTPAFVHKCFTENKDPYTPDGPMCNTTAQPPVSALPQK